MDNVATTSNGCGCGCGGGGGGIPVPIPTPTPGGSGQPIIVRSAPNLQIGNIIRQYIENGILVYQLEDFILQKPIVQFVNNAPVIEVGQLIPTVTFSGQIQQGSYPISNRSLTPDPGEPVDLTVPFSFDVENVKRITPGTAALFTLSATDDHSNTVAVQSGVAVKYAFYQGFNGSPSLNETQIKELQNRSLNDNILQQYGGKKTYVVPNSPAVPAYIWWWRPNGTPGISAALLGGFDLPLVNVGPVDVTNPFDGSIVTSYIAQRTANLLDPGSYDITLS